MANKEVKQWITVKGVHIPVFDGESIQDAIKHRFKNIKPNNTPVKETEGKNPEPDFHSEHEAYEYYRKKFSECSSTYRNKVATKLNIEGRGQAKIDALARAMTNRWKTSHNVVSDQGQKEKQIQASKQQAEVASKAAPPEEKPFTDPLGGIFGKRERVEDVTDKLDDLYSTKTGIINPHYNDRPQPKGNNYHNNCALCTAATILQAKGYNVEAMVQPQGRHYEIDDIMKIDTSNPDNYILASNSSGHFGQHWNIANAVEKEVKRKYIETHGEEPAYPTAWTTPERYNSPEGREQFRKYHEYREGLRTEVDKAIKQRSMPRGAEAVTRAVCDRVEKWGNGAIGELSVSWAKTTSSHSMVIYNDGGIPILYCSQTNKRYAGREAIKKVLEKTKANHTMMVRWDNASFKTDEQGNVLSGVKDVLNKMVKRRGGTI